VPGPQGERGFNGTQGPPGPGFIAPQSCPSEKSVTGFNSIGEVICSEDIITKDLVIANRASNHISIHLGDGTGWFGPGNNIAAIGNQPVSVVGGEFNGDTFQDLAVANAASNSVSIYLGIGNGLFGPATNFAVGGQPQSIAIGNFNGDGSQDLAVANFGLLPSSNVVSILLGIGNGLFGPATNFAVGDEPQSVAIGNFNGDSFPDLAVANAGSDNVSILLGTGIGSFVPATNFVVNGDHPIHVIAADLNGDTLQDLATANINSDNISIFLGTGTGSFGLPGSFGVGADPVSILVGEFK
jgi:hypothetical protein